MMNYMKQKRQIHKLKKEDIWEGVFALLTAALAITLCSRSSFLAPFNNWDDVNSYFSMGKALFNGKVIYRDVLDQKGPLLYFICGICYLISKQDFLGLYIVEVIMAGFFLWGCLRILKLYLHSCLSYVFLPVLSAVIYSSVSFWWGGSAEELCLPFFVWPLYFMLAYFKGETKESMGNIPIAVTGLCAGAVALIKFNSLGFFAAWMLVVVIGDLQNKRIKEMFVHCFRFLGWMLVLFLPWIFYFAVHDALFFWYQGYIYYNVFVYADFSQESFSVGARIYSLAKILYWLIREHIQYFAFILLGIGTTVLHPKKKWLEKFAVLALMFFLFLGIYIGGVELKYYSLPLSVFAVLGFAQTGMFLEWAGEKFLEKRNKKNRERRLPTGAAMVMVSILCSMLFMDQVSLNTDYRKTKKEDLYLSKLYSAMEVTKDTTLLNISCFDAGLYTMAGIVPNCYWFQTQTLPLDSVLTEQSEYIKEQKTDYIVAREYYPGIIWEGYDLIAEVKEEERDFTYYLFRKKTDI